MLAHEGEARAVALERLAVRGQDPIDVQAFDGLDRIEEFGQHVVTGPPAYVGRDVFEDVIAGDEIAMLRRVEADVAGGVTGGPDDFERTSAHGDALAAFQFPRGRESGTRDAAKALVHFGAELG